MLTGKDIIFISSIEWDFLWQHPQEISTRLAEAGNRVLFVENTGVRSPTIKDTSRVLRRLKLWSKSLSSGGVRQIQPNLYVCSPLVLPPFGPRWRRQINRRVLLPLVRRTAKSLGMTDPVLWTHLPTDTALKLIQLLRTPWSIVVYYCIADFSQLTPYAHQLKQSEKSIVQTSDIVFANSLRLAEHCKQWRDEVHVFPPGVNLSAFPSEETSRNEAVDEGPGVGSVSSDRLSGRPDAVIGYVGGLHRYVDLALVSAMARARPDWRWVFVGSVHTALGDLTEIPNVVLLGQRPHRELARHIVSFDVCIVPYLDNSETATVVPVKINEYLAAGKPVVSTDLPAVREFNDLHRVLITAKPAPDSFLKAIERALAESKNKADSARRREVAVLADWGQRLEAMSRLIEAKEQQQRIDAP